MEKKNILFLYQDPTPYNIDLFNEINNSPDLIVDVIYTVKHDNGEGAHIYRKLPKIKFKHKVLGNNLLRDFIYIYREINKSKDSEIVVMGYSDKLIMLTILMLSLKKRKFISEADGYIYYNPIKTLNFLSFLKDKLRAFLRMLIINNSHTLLMAGGIKGKKQAISIGFDSKNIVDFPYAISKDRITSSVSTPLPIELKNDVKNNTVIFISARFIKRKGHKELIEEIIKLQDYNFILWLEGIGPLLDEISSLVQAHGLEDKVRFLGFCQMKHHNWLLTNSAIVIVPSLADPWGIVVDEGMKCGKIVISTIYTGSAIDRISHEKNGFLYDPLKKSQLYYILKSIFDDEYDLEKIKTNALITGEKYDVSYNRRNLELALSQR